MSAKEQPLGWWRWLCVLAFAFYGAHAAWFLQNGRPECLLWGCHLAVVGIGAGLLLRFPVFAGMGVISLMWGVPLWLFDVATGGEFILTSMLTHVGGAILGVAAIWRLGMPRGTWLVLWVTTAALIVFSRLVDPVNNENVNMAWGPPPGWEGSLPQYPTFGIILFSGAAVTFFSCEQIVRWVFRSRLWDPPAPKAGAPSSRPAPAGSAGRGSAGSPTGTQPTYSRPGRGPE